jgi:hypothetical protein
VLASILRASVHATMQGLHSRQAAAELDEASIICILA